MTYNIQGWLTNKVAKQGTTQQFNLDLRYYTKAKSASTVRYNGNISEIEWQQGNTSSSDRYTYAYTYDLMNRLTNTTRYTGTSTTATNAYTEKGIGYDKNGNITTLARYGSSTSTKINDLTYTYTGNRLTTLKDNGTTKTYSYDNNGNITVDGRRGMNIHYNLLNLPKSVFGSMGDVLMMEGEYTYLADGTKVEAVNAIYAGYTYLGSLIYKKIGSTRTLEKVVFSDGVVLKNGSTYEPRYYTTDHLGSIRMITKANGTVDERSDYYPFGLEAQISTYPKMISNYTKFSGKEDQKFVNTKFNYLDFGARMYDPVIGRWSTTDPLSEKYKEWSPYNYCMNSPIIVKDFNGRDTVWVFDSGTKPKSNKEYSASIYFEKNGQIVGPYTGSSYPDKPGSRTLNEGAHSYNNKSGHSSGSRKGLNIVDEDGNRNAPGTDAKGEAANMTNVNVHDSYKDDRRYSEGCITIPHGDPQGFMNNFDWSGSYNGKKGNTGKSTGKLILKRGDSAKTAKKRIINRMNSLPKIKDPIKTPEVEILR